MEFLLMSLVVVYSVFALIGFVLVLFGDLFPYNQIPKNKDEKQVLEERVNELEGKLKELGGGHLSLPSDEGGSLSYAEQNGALSLAKKDGAR